MYHDYSENERIVRAGQLLAFGVRRLLLESPPAMEASSLAQKDGDLPMEEATILSFLDKVRTASPVEIRSKFNMSRTTTYRRLRDLERRGLIRRSGRSRSVVYEIAA